MQTPNTTTLGLNQWAPQDPLNTTQFSDDNQIIDDAFQNIKEQLDVLLTWNPATFEITLEMSELADFIASIRQVNRNFIIRVKPGTTTDVIALNGVECRGNIEIIAVDHNGVPTTAQGSHNISAFTVFFCNISRLHIRGFTATAATGEAFFFEYSGGYYHLQNCFAVGGNISDAANYGVRAATCSGEVFVNACTISNKFRAITCAQGRLITLAPLGTGNHTLYVAQNAAIVQIRALGTISGTTTYQKGEASLIVLPDGTLV